MPHRRIQIRIDAVFPDIDRNDEDTQQSYPNEPPGFRIVEIGPNGTAADGKKQGPKIHPGNQHEADADGLDYRRVEVAKTGIMSRKSAQTHG